MSDSFCSSCNRQLVFGTKCLDCLHATVDEQEAQHLIKAGREKHKIRKMKQKRG